jgi:hypothetical protein
MNGEPHEDDEVLRTHVDNVGEIMACVRRLADGDDTAVALRALAEREAIASSVAVGAAQAMWSAGDHSGAVEQFRAAAASSIAAATLYERTADRCSHSGDVDVAWALRHAATFYTYTAGMLAGGAA